MLICRYYQQKHWYPSDPAKKQLFIVKNWEMVRFYVQNKIAYQALIRIRFVVCVWCIKVNQDSDKDKFCNQLFFAMHMHIIKDNHPKDNHNICSGKQKNRATFHTQYREPLFFLGKSWQPKHKRWKSNLLRKLMSKQKKSSRPATNWSIEEESTSQSHPISKIMLRELKRHVKLHYWFPVR